MSVLFLDDGLLLPEKKDNYCHHGKKHHVVLSLLIFRMPATSFSYCIYVRLNDTLGFSEFEKLRDGTPRTFNDKIYWLFIGWSVGSLPKGTNGIQRKGTIVFLLHVSKTKIQPFSPSHSLRTIRKTLFEPPLTTTVIIFYNNKVEYWLCHLWSDFIDCDNIDFKHLKSITIRKADSSCSHLTPSFGTLLRREKETPCSYIRQGSRNTNHSKHNFDTTIWTLQTLPHRQRRLRCLRMPLQLPEPTVRLPPLAPNRRLLRHKKPWRQPVLPWLLLPPKRRIQWPQPGRSLPRIKIRKHKMHQHWSCRFPLSNPRRRTPSNRPSRPRSWRKRRRNSVPFYREWWSQKRNSMSRQNANRSARHWVGETFARLTRYDGWMPITGIQNHGSHIYTHSTEQMIPCPSTIRSDGPWFTYHGALNKPNSETTSAHYSIKQQWVKTIYNIHDLNSFRKRSIWEKIHSVIVLEVLLWLQDALS